MDYDDKYKNIPNSILEDEVIPIVEERLSVDKELYVKSRIEIIRTTEVKDVCISENLVSNQVEVTRVPIGEYITSIPVSRIEDGFEVIPVYEEHVEVIKRIYLKEEIKIKNHAVIEKHEAKECIKYQDLKINKYPQ